MSNSITNVSFKGVYRPKRALFTKTQENVIEKIKSELGKDYEKVDFLVKPIDKDKVKLSRAYDLEVKNLGVDTKITYSGDAYIGTYNNANPFKVQDYKDAQKRWLKETISTICIGIMELGLLFGVLYLCGKCGASTMLKSQNATTIMKDSTQKVTKDTLNLLIK